LKVRTLPSLISAPHELGITEIKSAHLNEMLVNLVARERSVL
jgi:hypothetical protein